MTVKSITAGEHKHIAVTQANKYQICKVASKLGRFILHLLEMLLAMMAGMVVLYLLDIFFIPESSSFAVFVEYGTIQFDFAMAVFMTLPMAAWMIIRGHGRHHVAEMVLGMNAPVAVIIVLRLLGAEANLPWLAYASHPMMFLGMIVPMLYRRDHYSVKAGHVAHATHGDIN